MMLLTLLLLVLSQICFSETAEQEQFDCDKPSLFSISNEE